MSGARRVPGPRVPFGCAGLWWRRSAARPSVSSRGPFARAGLRSLPRQAGGAGGRAWGAAVLALALGLLPASPAAAQAASAPPDPPAGVVVEAVPVGSMAEAAGLRPGDLLLSWCRGFPPAAPLAGPETSPEQGSVLSPGPAAAPAGAVPLAPAAPSGVPAPGGASAASLAFSPAAPVSQASAPAATGCAAAGPLESPFDLGAMDIEQAPRGGVVLRGRREMEERSWSLLPGSQKLEVRPVLAEDQLRIYQEGRDLAAAGKPEAAAELWRAAAGPGGDGGSRGERRLALWWLSRAAGVLAAAHRARAADALYEQAVARAGLASAAGARQAPRDLAAAPVSEVAGTAGAVAPIDAQAAVELLMVWGKALQNRAQWVRAEGCYQQALDLLSGHGGPPAGAGGQAESGDSGALLLARRPPSAGAGLGEAAALEGLGTVAAQRGDLDRAEELLGRVLAQRERLAPGSWQLARSLADLGNVALLRGDPATASTWFRRAVAMGEGLAPQSSEFAVLSISLGNAALDRWRLAEAEEAFERGRAILARVRPGSLEMGSVLQNLGVVAARRGDPERAGELFRRSLAVKQKADPGGVLVATSLENLGLLVGGFGDSRAEEDYLLRALKFAEERAAGTPLLARILYNLGSFYELSGRLDQAQAYLDRALAIRQRLNPGGLEEALTLSGLAHVAAGRGDLAKAEALFLRVLAMTERVAPGSLDLASAQSNLGDLRLRQGRAADAAELHCQAVDSIEGLRRRLGGAAETRQAFAATVENFYATCLEELVGQGKTAEAFEVLERGRARAFLEQLAERDLVPPSEVPPEIGRRRRELDRDYDTVRSTLSRLNPVRDAAEVDRLRARLNDIRGQQEAVLAELRRASPRLASLRYPQPLGLAGARAALDPGTVLLSFYVSTTRSFLFVVRPDATGVTVFSLPFGSAQLGSEIELFRKLAQREGTDRAALTERAEHLYHILLAPAEPLIAPARRLLVSAHGPLHFLPFAALMRKGGFPGGGSYLVEWKPIHLSASATAYAEIKRSRRTAGVARGELVAFGDPLYPAAVQRAADAAAAESSAAPAGGQVPAASLELVSAVRRGLDLTPLPATRREVQDIAALAPGARMFLGAEATEERAKSIGKDARWIHFACHGLLDERSPLDSALALTIPDQPAAGQDNGLLQAWEILEQMHLDADLVTLSACDTALGGDGGGEGLIGLTRAFQFAGARSVLASLWSVADVSTGDLMRRFYGYLFQGRTKDEALRAAQLDLLHLSGDRLSHPYHWAAFQLVGDFR